MMGTLGALLWWTARGLSRTNDALRRETERLEQTLRSITDGFHLIDASGRFVEFNPAAREMFAAQGLSTDALIGKHIFDEVFPPARDLPGGHAIQRTLIERMPTDAESFYAPWQRWYFLRNYPTPDGGVATFFQDISERKQAEEALREGAQRLQLTTHAAGIGLWEWNVVTNQIRWDAQMFRLYGVTLTPDHVVPYSTWRDAVLPEDFAGQDAMLQERVRTHVGGPRSFRIRRVSDGSVRHIEAVDAVRINSAGETEWVVGTNMDVTERKEAEEALRASEARFRAAVGAVSSLIWTNNARGEMEGEQPGWGGFTGQSPEEYKGYGWARAVHPEDAQPTIDAWNQAVAEKRMFEFEHRVRRNDCEWRLCFVRAVPVLGKAGEIREWVGVHTDITERKAADESLRKSEERYRSLVFVVTDVPWVRNAEGAFVAPQPAWAKYTGQTWEEYRDFGWVNAKHPDDRAEIQSIWEKACCTRRVYQARGRMFHAEFGEYRHFEVRAVPLLNSDGSVREWVGTCRDCHEERTASQKLERTVAERTAQLRDTVQQLETFSYSIVHDMRAPLRSMRSFAGFLQNDYGDKLDQTGLDYLSRIMSSARRLDALITDVLSFSRVSMQEAELQRVNLDSLLKDLMEQYPQFLEAAANIHVQCPLPVVLGNSALLTQVFSNLMGNALKFVVPDREPNVTVRSENLDGSNRVRVWVEDNGIGIPLEHRQKLFGLFQRLHKPDEYAGTGVGLAIVKKAVERMGGTVGVESEPNQGSRFWIEMNAMPPSLPR